uniref:DUF1263 domain-containing protein n=1 Tax=Oryza nivara TaxID=4536 RepID=A0A0E0IT09_ORYNI
MDGRGRVGSFIFPASSPLVVGLLQLISSGLPITMQGGDGEAAPMASPTGLPACLPVRGEPSVPRGDEGRAMRTGRQQVQSLACIDSNNR